MKRFFLLVFISSFSSCISSTKTNIVLRNEILQIEKSKKTPFAKILVQWKNYKYSDYHKVSQLLKNEEDVVAVEVDQEDYLKLKKRLINIFRENGIYDEVNGTGTVKVVVVTYGRWDYSELFSTFLVDTGYVLILPSSIVVKYKMFFEAEQQGFKYKTQKEAEIKTTFHFLLFPLYPFSTYSGKEKFVFNNMIYDFITEWIDVSNKALSSN